MKNKKQIKLLSLVLLAVFLFTLVVTASFAAEKDFGNSEESIHKDLQKDQTPQEKKETEENNEQDNQEKSIEEQSFLFENINYKIIWENIDEKTGHVAVSNNQESIKRDLVIPSYVLHNGIKYSVVEIADDAFNGSKIEGKLVIPDSVLKIGQRAFKNTGLLKSTLVFSEKIEQISQSAFYGSGICNFIFLKSDFSPLINQNAFSNVQATAYVPWALEKEYIEKLEQAGFSKAEIKSFSNSDAQIIEFSWDGVFGEINESKKEITLALPQGQDLSKVLPNVAFIGQLITPSSFYEVDFGNNVLIEVVSRDSSYKSTYSVYVLSEPLITRQPESIKVAQFGSTYFDVEAKGNPLSYQWKISEDSGENWTDVLDNPTAKEARLKISNVNENAQYYCEVKNGISAVRSQNANVTIGTPASIIGPKESLELEYGYESTSTYPFFLKGSNPISLSVQSENEKITWNTSILRLSVEEGLPPGNYQTVILVGNNFGEVSRLTYEVIVRPKIEQNSYEVLDGLSEFSGKGELQTRIDASCDKFFELLIDGQVIDKEHYNIRSGSTVITLKESFLSSLENGEHTLSARFFDGKTDMKLIINAPSSKPFKLFEKKTKDEIIAAADDVSRNYSGTIFKVLIVSLSAAFLSILALKLADKK